VRAIGYACLNTMSQQPKNFGLEEQEQIISQYAAQNGLVLVGIEKETTESSNTQNQPKLRQLMEESGNGQYEVLVVARLDRLTRNIRQLSTIVNSVCLGNGIKLVSVEEGLDSRTESGRMALGIIDIVTKWDTKRISDRTREIIARKRAKGERVGHAPFGYTYKNKKLVAVETELKTVQLIRDQREKGQSYHKIAKFLNDHKIVSKRGGIWYAETVKTVFKNSFGPKKSFGMASMVEAGD